MLCCRVCSGVLLGVGVKACAVLVLPKPFVPRSVTLSVITGAIVFCKGDVGRDFAVREACRYWC